MEMHCQRVSGCLRNQKRQVTFNLKFFISKVGDIIEKYLIQNKDVTKVMKMAKLGR